MELLAVKHLTIIKENQGQELVLIKDGSFKLYDKEIICIIGPSGAGKSSLLKVLNGLENPLGGEILFNQKAINKMDVVSLRRQIGMVFQDPTLFSGTVEENLAFGPKLKGVTNAGVWRRALDLVGLDASFLQKDITTLSGGQAQRVSIARTLANEPRVLLLDEPTSALDPDAMDQIEQLLLELKAKLSIGILWVSHNMEQVKRVADRVLLVNGGTLQEIEKYRLGERMIV